MNEPFKKSKNEVILQLSAQLSEQAALIEKLQQAHPSSHTRENKTKTVVTSSAQASHSDRHKEHLPYNDTRLDSSVSSYGGVENLVEDISGKSTSPIDASSPIPKDWTTESGQVRRSRDSGLGSAGTRPHCDNTTESQVLPFKQSPDSSSEWESDDLKSTHTKQNLRTRKKNIEPMAPGVHRTDSTTSEEELKRLVEIQQPVMKTNSFNRNRFELNESDRFNIPRTTYAFEV